MSAPEKAEAPSLTLRYAIELAIANELNMRDIYADLANRALEPEMLKLWDAMSLSEKRHAELLEQIRDDVPGVDLETHVDFSLVPLDAFARQLDSFRERMEGNDLSRDQVFRQVLNLELGEQNGVLLELLSACPTPLTQRLETEVAAPSDRHLQGLMKAIERFSEDRGLISEVRALRAGGRV